MKQLTDERRTIGDFFKEIEKKTAVPVVEAPRGASEGVDFRKKPYEISIVNGPHMGKKIQFAIVPPRFRLPVPVSCFDVPFKDKEIMTNVDVNVANYKVFTFRQQLFAIYEP